MLNGTEAQDDVAIERWLAADLVRLVEGNGAAEGGAQRAVGAASHTCEPACGRKAIEARSRDATADPESLG